MHRNKWLQEGFAGGKFMRSKRNKQDAPHGRGSGLPKVAPHKKSGTNHAYIQKLEERNRKLRRKIKKSENSQLKMQWQFQFKKRKEDIALAK